MNPRLGARGVALAAVLFALAVLSALLVASFLVAVWERRTGDSAAQLHRARGASESGAVALLSLWNDDTMRALRPFPGAPYDVAERASPGGSGRVAARVARLTRTLYLITVEGASGDPSSLWRHARSRTGLLVGVNPLPLPARAALVTAGPVELSGAAAVNGRDHVPNATWTDCAPADTARPGVLTAPGARVSVAQEATLDGEPPAAPDAAVQPSTLASFGDETYSDLAARAHIRLGGGVVLSTGPVVSGLGECEPGVSTNWGDGRRRDGPCGEHFPLVHIAGDAELVGGQGQGILLVDGNLTVTGDYEFFGVIVLRGALRGGASGSPARVFGTVLTHAMRGVGATLTDRFSVSYSKCATDKALAEWGTVQPLSSRAFVSLY